MILGVQLTLMPSANYNTSFTPTSSVREQSDADDLKGFTSSDDVSDIDISDGEQLLNTVQPFYSNDMISDNDDGFVHNSPSESAEGNSDDDSVNNSTRNSCKFCTFHTKRVSFE